MLAELDVPATVFVTTGYIGSEDGFWTDRLAALLHGSDLPVTHLELELAGTRVLIDVHTARARERAYRYLHRHLNVLAPVEIEAALTALFVAAGTQPTVPRSALPLDVEQLRELARSDLIAIGAHSVTHARLASLDEAGQRVEIADSQRHLEELIGQAVRAFAYPFGAAGTIDETSVAIARQVYDLAVTTEAAPVVASTDAYRIPRFNVGNWTADEFAVRLASWLEA